MNKGLRYYVRRLLDSRMDVREKMFIILTNIGMIALFFSIIVDLFLGENIVEVLTLLATIVIAPVITYAAIYMHKVQLGATILAAGIIFIVVPLAFYYGGGMTGGGVIWFCFAYLYVGLILVGVTRIVMITLLTIFLVSLFVITYFNPQLIESHDRFMWFVDSSVSVLFVGFAVYFMVLIQYKLYQGENARTMEQAKKIEEMNRAQNRFFSSMSHEIRTPINTIIGLNEMILRSDVGDDVIENATNIQSASRILLSLINDILDMSKIESGKMDIVKEQYDVAKMLSEIVNMIWFKANEKGLEFSVSVDPSIPSQLFSDEMRIKQILINLLNNAVKYTKEGSVTLSVHCARIEGGKALITYSVEDTGIGIRKESIPHLFDAFRREDTDKTRFIEGTGLGLSIVKQLVELLGGTVSVNSVYTKGSTFVVTIEQEIADEKVVGSFDFGKIRSIKERVRYHQSFEAPEARLLVVDDNATNLLVVKKLLKDTGIRIDTAESGERCLELTLQNIYNVILMDHLMPGMDGIECFHAIREQAGGLCKETPVIALTANAGSESQALFRREGFDEYLVKPVDAIELENVVRKHLPEDLVMGTVRDAEEYNTDTIIREMKKKTPIMITTDSAADIPSELLGSFGIPVIPYKVRMNEGVFYDGTETGSDAVIMSMNDGVVIANSEVPSVTEYEDFFSEQLTKAQHLIHISTAKHVSKGYVNACEAALAFYNVRVFDSGQLSSGLGMLTLYAKELAESGNYDADAIVSRLEEKKEKIRTSFIVGSTGYLYRGGHLSSRINMICNALMLHPVMETRNSAMHLAGFCAGDYLSTRDKYIKSVFGQTDGIDNSVLFITYAGMKLSEVEKIREEVRKLIGFDRVYLQKASASVAINCGNGSFGLIYARR